MQAQDVVIVGRIGRPHGVHGWVRITSYTDPPDNLLGYRPWLLEDHERWRFVEPEAVQKHRNGFVVRLPGVNDRTAAARLAGRHVAVARAALPQLQDGEFYWRDLEGLNVRRCGVELGTVDHLLETGATPVLVVRDGDREILIPFVGEHVADVNLAAGRIDVTWQEED